MICLEACVSNHVSVGESSGSVAKAVALKLRCCAQGQKHISTSVFHPPSEGAQLAAASFQQAHLTVMWSTGLLQSYNTALATGNTLSIHTSRRLRAFDLGSNSMMLDHQQEDQHHQQEPAKQHPGKKKRKSAATAREPAPDSDTGSAAPAPMLVPLGGHSVAAIREPTDLPSNGHHSADLEITVADTQYGCIQSVTCVKLPGGGAVGRGGRDQQEALQLSSGMGNLVLLMHGAVWYISIQVRVGWAEHMLLRLDQLVGFRTYPLQRKGWLSDGEVYLA